MKKILQILTTDGALSEISAAYKYYESKQEDLGESFLSMLETTYKSIMKSPNGFQSFHNYRQVPIDHFPYIVVYEVIENQLIIFAVFHTSQNPNKKMR